MSLPSAQPVEWYVWCLECNDVHEADFEKNLLVNDASSPCLGIESIPCEALPIGWDRDHWAEFGDNSEYELFPKNPPLQPYHRPMYYLETT